MPSILLRDVETNHVFMFDSRVQNQELDSSGRRKVRAAAKIFKNKKNAFLVTQKAIVWNVLPRLDGTQMLSSYAPRFIAAMIKGNFLYNKTRFLQLSI